jgi:MoaA/NifB/PqqE/SkfB family radical SAM enzyme
MADMANESIIKSIEWRITDKCNYRCEYCFQSKHKSRDCSDEVRRKVLDFTGSLGGGWFVKLIGGEPFVCGHFFDTCKELVAQGHTLALTTNFSKGREDFERLVEITGDKLTGITASLHLSQVGSVADFIEKCRWFESAKHADTEFTVTSVLTEDNFEQLKAIEKQLKDNGVAFSYQRLKTDGAYAAYTTDIEEYVKDKFISNLENTYQMKSFGTKCYTGMYFFRIMLSGNVLRCYNSQPAFNLGSLVDGTFRPFNKPLPCMSRKCTCTTPANRNMILWDQKSSFITTVARNLPVAVSQRLRKLSNKVSASKK